MDAAKGCRKQGMWVPAANGSGPASCETIETILRFDVHEAMWLLRQQTFRFARQCLQLAVNLLQGTDFSQDLAIDALK
jgi:hypothetical protein